MPGSGARAHPGAEVQGIVQLHGSVGDRSASFHHGGNAPAANSFLGVRRAALDGTAGLASSNIAAETCGPGREADRLGDICYLDRPATHSRPPELALLERAAVPLTDLELGVPGYAGYRLLPPSHSRLGRLGGRRQRIPVLLA